ncbi:cobaltochelatase subunit CobN [Pseudohoeflea coraliihabitans]|uniref:Cobaltochelatase subunit CobN n=1 Tax=Pseudohoeflea coraliihabitans TaxID=2860393 RepID=A0ABS6WIQ9_9HYPH|nr:cobaltochelatase subunit CobN [Pseudohoeflea sp. DP4N28-3]MBW3095755.1 cobaltochelatase subunit CobN [Pseudohoeflea sp. DP4N28-3]
MHLLAAQQGTLAEEGEALDLAQTPGDVIFLSAADTELAAVAQACGGAGLDWRLASLTQLRHPLSIDTYVERTVCKARLIVVRALGGVSYFSYALEAIHAAATAQDIKLAVLPGDERPDPELAALSTVDAAWQQQLGHYLSEGGALNMSRFVTACEACLSDAEAPPPAAPLLRAGLYWPGEAAPSVASLSSRFFAPDRPVAALVFYRALVQSGQLTPVDAFIEELRGEGLNPLPIFVASLKDGVSQGVVQSIFAEMPPAIVLNATGFAVASPGGETTGTVLEATGAPVLQALFSSIGRDAWAGSSQGLGSRDLAMHVALPEIDGRVLTRAVSFKAAARYDDRVQTNIVTHAPDRERMRFVAQQAKGWAALRSTPAAVRKVAIILANYPNRDGRIANGVGLDTPAATLEVLRAMSGAGYGIPDLPADGDQLIARLREGPTNARGSAGKRQDNGVASLPLGDYRDFFASLPDAVRQAVVRRWGQPEADPMVAGGSFRLALQRFGNALVGIQPARGYNIDPKASYHDPDLVPPHGYFAFYAYLRSVEGVDAVLHMGKHGNLEWLPGKALALSSACYPEAVLGPVPHIYPFIVNDPGEGTQAKRRSSAVIIDHLTPPLTRAESYGALADLEALVDEFYEASGHDPRRLKLLKGQILELVRDIGLDEDAGIAEADDDDLALQKLDAYLCDLKEMQIRDGLHVFGVAPAGRLRDDLVVALARLPRGTAAGEASLHRALAADGLAAEGQNFDPLDCDFSAPWHGPRPQLFHSLSTAPWRSCGDTVERIELLASALVSGALSVPQGWRRSAAVMAEIHNRLIPAVTACGQAELKGVLTALEGRFVAPGPSGAPTRGRPDVLPTGRNFYSVDSRAIPTPAAWELGRKSAELLVTRHAQDHGEWPTSLALTAWGTSNMRTGGDDIAQAMALIGAKPVWDTASRRVTGYEIIPLAKMARPRVDVILRISGFFRDAFPDQIALFDRAARAIAERDEEAADNPLAARFVREKAELIAAGASSEEAARNASFRVFGSKPGSYGAGLQALIDEKGWSARGDLAEAFIVWGGYAYGARSDGQAEGQAARGLFEKRLSGVEAVVQNQDNREHDLLDSDDYYQFEGGMTAAVEALSGQRPAIYHNDHSRPERPLIRSLEEEIARVVRGRAANPKWISGVMRHGYKGAFEMAATVDYLFAFAATTGAVRDHHFEALYAAYLCDAAILAFLREKNPDALREMAERFGEAIDRQLWTPRSNSAMFALEELAAGRTADG